jgi:hypothetical protein
LQLACALLESCGRFLFLTPHTHTRLKGYLSTMERLKRVKSLDPTLEVRAPGDVEEKRPLSFSRGPGQVASRPPRFSRQGWRVLRAIKNWDNRVSCSR